MSSWKHKQETTMAALEMKKSQSLWDPCVNKPNNSSLWMWEVRIKESRMIPHVLAQGTC